MRKLIVASSVVVLGGTLFVALEVLRSNANAATSAAPVHAAADPAPQSPARAEHVASRPPTSRAPALPDVFPREPAPGEPPPTPAMQRRDLIERLTATGANAGPWARAGATLVERWRTEAPADAAGVAFSPAHCFTGGCLVTATYPDMQRFEAVNRTFPESEAFRGWNGPKYRTPPEQRADGRWEADWVFLPPDEPNHEPLDH